MRVRYNRSRRGFTLVELMVAAALTILIMTIISMAFQSGLTTLSHLKSMGDLAERLRIAQDRLRDDLESEHFDRFTSVGPMKVSDLRYDLVGTGSGFAMPSVGYFRLEQLSGNTYEGQDSTNMISTRSTGGNNRIEFTIRRRLSEPDKLLAARLNVPAINMQSLTDTDLSGQYIASWARVRWELGNPQTINGVAVYTLYRSVRLLANNSPVPLTTPAELNEAQAVMSVDAANNVQRIDGATVFATRPGITPYPEVGLNSQKRGDDIVMTNVVSFEVKPTWVADMTVAGSRQPRTTFTNPGLNNPIVRTPGAGVINTDFPFDDMPTSLFDTSPVTPNNPATLPFRARITALQIKIRVYEPKNNMTRQSTIIVKL